MCQWILEARLSTRISQDLIVKSFTITGISNKMNGSEDDFLWHRSDVDTCQERMTDKWRRLGSEIMYFNWKQFIIK